MEQFELIISIIIGLFLCFFGYRMKKIAFFIAWFAVGFMLTKSLMPWLSESLNFLGDYESWQSIFAILGGLLLSLVGFSIEKLCLSLLCVVGAVAIGINQYGLNLEVVLISIIIGVIIGAFSVRLIKPVTILITAAAGAALIVPAVLSFFPTLVDPQYNILVIAGLAFVGAICQLTTTKSIE